jgi:hypothetical protein
MSSELGDTTEIQEMLRILDLMRSLSQAMQGTPKQQEWARDYIRKNGAQLVADLERICASPNLSRDLLSFMQLTLSIIKLWVAKLDEIVESRRRARRAQEMQLEETERVRAQKVQTRKVAERKVQEKVVQRKQDETPSLDLLAREAERLLRSPAGPPGP